MIFKKYWEIKEKEVLILDCTLRDGGYYTNWDFPEELVNTYFEAVNKLPLDYIEIGYISKPQDIYKGAYFYLPFSILKDCREKCTHQLAIMLNQKDISLGEYGNLLEHSKGLVDLVRLAVKPDNLEKAILAGQEIKNLGYDVALNLMYASEWKKNFPDNEQLKEIKNIFKFFYIVDSYGGLLPTEVREVIDNFKNKSSVEMGFHGHNNLELAMANALSAMDAGVNIIDSTILGMGRGAGNLRTELLLSILYKLNNLHFDFDILNTITERFMALREEYKWGTNLPFMVSGVESLPQDSVMSKVTKRYFSLNGFTGNSNFSKRHHQSFELELSNSRAILIGGGDTVKQHSIALNEFLKNYPDIPVIYASSKNVGFLVDLPNPQLHFLAGNEGKRLERELDKIHFNNRIGIIVPDFFNTINYIPDNISQRTVYLADEGFQKKYKRSVTAVILQFCIQNNIKELYLSGYDGYGVSMDKPELELFEENDKIFKEFSQNLKLISLTPTEYNIESQSIYTLI